MRTERAMLKEAARLIRSQLRWYDDVNTEPGAPKEPKGSRAALAQQMAKWSRDFDDLPLPEPDPPRPKCKKISYRKERQAISAALDLEAKGKGPLWTYRCPKCLRFHLTSTPRKVVKGRR